MVFPLLSPLLKKLHLAPETSNPAGRLACLDGIRGMAILFVLLGHVSNVRGLLFVGSGEFGVWLFFVLSAFLLSLYFFQEPSRMRRPIEWVNYALRRFLRIYPAYTIALAVGTVVGMKVGFLDSMLLKAPAYWAVFVEFRYYLLLPLVVVTLHLLGKVNRALPPAVLALAIIVHFQIFPKSATVPGYDPWGHEDILFWEYLVVFLIGSFTAWVYVQTQHLRPLLSSSRAFDRFLIVAAAAPWLAAPHMMPRLLGLNADTSYYHLDWVPWSAMFAFLIYGVMMSSGTARRIFESHILRFFGYISFSLYLFMDYLIYPMADAIRPKGLYFVSTMAAVVLLTTITFVVIERPLSRVSLLRAPQRALGTSEK